MGWSGPTSPLRFKEAPQISPMLSHPALPLNSPVCNPSLQFYGACVQGDELMLVVEYMEVLLLLVLSTRNPL